MLGLLRKSTWRGFALLFSVPLVVLGCGDFDREFGAGGTDKSGSRLIVEQIEPSYFEESTNQVDVIQVDCAAGTGEDEDWEPYSDHYAVVSISNRPLNNATEQTATVVHLFSYELSYTPVTQGSPPFASSNVFPIAGSVAIDACTPGSTSCPTVDFTVELVPIIEKAVLRGYVEDPQYPSQLHYNAHYIFFGENDYGEPVSADGFTDFYASGYDNCGGG